MKTPDMRVAIMGVWKRSLTFAKNLKRSPSEAIAYIIRGIAQILVNKLIKYFKMNLSARNFQF